jgi:hypothetical protein
LPAEDLRLGGVKLERLRVEDLRLGAVKFDRPRAEDPKLGDFKLELPLLPKLRLLPVDFDADLPLDDQPREACEGCMRERLDDRLRDAPDDQLRDALDDRFREAPDDRPLEESFDRAKAGAANRMATIPRTVRPMATRRPVTALGACGWRTDMILSCYSSR